MKVGTKVVHKVYGIGTVVNEEVKYTRVKFDGHSLSVRTSELTEVKPKFNIGDKAVYRDTIGFPHELGNGSIVEVVDYDEENQGHLKQCYHVKFPDGTYWYCREDELTYKPKFNVGDFVECCDVLYTVVETLKTGNYLLAKNCYTHAYRMEHELTKVEPKFNVGDDVLLKDETEPRTVTDVSVGKYNYLVYTVNDSTEHWFDNALTKYVEPKFKVGDYVEIKGRSEIGKVFEVGDNIGVYVHNCVKEMFHPSELTLTKVEQEINVGDMIETEDGKLAEVIEESIYGYSKKYVEFEDGKRTQVNVSDVRVISESERTRIQMRRDYKAIDEIVDNFDCNDVDCNDCPFDNTEISGCNVRRIREIIKTGRGI